MCDPITFPVGCTPEEVVQHTAMSAWDTVCKSFADAAVSELGFFAKAFVAFPPIDLSGDGIRSVYGMSLGIASLVAVILLLVQVARTAITHDGAALAQAVVGIGKAALAFMVTLTVAGTALVAADELTVWIVNQSFGSPQGLQDKLTTFLKWAPTTAPSLLLMIAVVGIVLVTVLWFELLLRNVAVAVMIGTSPIAATGMASDASKEWFPRLVSATIRLVVLKPVIALVFAVGFGLAGDAQPGDLNGLFTGLVVLLLAVLAWPAIGRFFTFVTVHSGGPNGIAAVVGFASNTVNTRYAGAPGSVSPDEFGQAAESRTLAEYSSRTGSASNSVAAAGGGAAAGAAAIPYAVGRGLEMAQRAANSLVGRSEQMAGHAGLAGAAPHATPAGQPRQAWPTPPSVSAPEPTTQPASPPVERTEVQVAAPITTVEHAPPTPAPPPVDTPPTSTDKPGDDEG